MPFCARSAARPCYSYRLQGATVSGTAVAGQGAKPCFRGVKKRTFLLLSHLKNKTQMKTAVYFTVQRG